MDEIVPEVGRFAYVKPCYGRWNRETLDVVHRGLITNVCQGSTPDVINVSVVFDDVPDFVPREQTFYADELDRVTVPHAMAC